MTENGASPYASLIAICVLQSILSAALMVYGIVRILMHRRRQTVRVGKANAAVTDVQVTQRRLRWYSPPSAFFIPVYTYTVDGVEYKLNGTGSFFEPDVIVGAPATVMYDPRDPKHAYVASRTQSASDGAGVMCICVGGISLALMLMLLLA